MIDCQENHSHLPGLAISESTITEEAIISQFSVAVSKTSLATSFLSAGDDDILYRTNTNQPVGVV